MGALDLYCNHCNRMQTNINDLVPVGDKKYCTSCLDFLSQYSSGGRSSWTADIEAEEAPCKEMRLKKQ